MSQKHTLQEFSTQEGKNVELGQAGYKIVEVVADEGGGEGAGFYTTGDGEWIGCMVLNGDATVTGTLHEPEGDSPIITRTSCPVGLLLRGYWKSIVVSRTAGTDACQIIVYKG